MSVSCLEYGISFWSMVRRSCFGKCSDRGMHAFSLETDYDP